MNWAELESAIPYVVTRPGVTAHTEKCVIYDAPSHSLRVAQPGLYEQKTRPLGGDFLIDLSSTAADWHRHAFKHADLFVDVEQKTGANLQSMRTVFANALVKVIAFGADPDRCGVDSVNGPGLEPLALLHAAQCLALCEHRRYKQFEPKGGRFLPMRFTLGIIFGLWSAAEAIRVEKSGLRGLNELRQLARREEPNERLFTPPA